jgi:hypothetical protein
MYCHYFQVRRLRQKIPATHLLFKTGLGVPYGPAILHVLSASVHYMFLKKFQSTIYLKPPSPE